MENENTIQNIEVLPQTDRLLDSPSDIQIEESVTMEEPTTTEEPTEPESSERSENPETTVLEGETENTETEIEESVSEETEETIIYQSVETIDYTESLTEINSTLHHIDQSVELGVCLFIIVVIIILMNYVYKFFKMFF